MSLSKYLKASKASLRHINGSAVALMMFVQISLWYPFLSQAQEELNKQAKLKARAEASWEKIQQQVNQLRGMSLLNETWVQHRVEDSEKGIPTQWSIAGAASLAEWQAVLEKVEAQYALGLLAASWQREKNGDWRGHLLFSLETPKANRVYHNWLPTKLHMNRFEPNDWLLLSTMRMGDKTSALVAYKHVRHWVSDGSWLPDAGVTVNGVSFGRVTLIAKDGSEKVLAMREKGVSDE
ncbi:hypothetical protein [Marinomonas rhizomae]|uniref:Uncharacterized protein n=1 Tax=Marinomonas rhizomae TaxID=491948 RepID=A0A366IWR6_9GAMM|nr:hypothetical protein [Marinomonas rhizomae]RBP78275.1 hypothetical protein DFP80_12011 [Marinomonas rhizomae]